MADDPVPAGGRSPAIDWSNLRLAKPCSVEWSSMAGDERRRFCESCRKSVYNLADLDRESAEAVIVAHEGWLCVRLWRRADGTLVTGDCRRARGAASLVPRFAAKGILALISLGAVSLGAATVASVTPESELAPVGTATRRMQEAILDLRIRLGIDPELRGIVVGALEIGPLPEAVPFDELGQSEGVGEGAEMLPGEEPGGGE